MRTSLPEGTGSCCGRGRLGFWPPGRDEGSLGEIPWAVRSSRMEDLGRSKPRALRETLNSW